MLLKCCYHITLILNEYRNNNVDYNGHYPKLPKGWCLCKLKNISLIITGSTPSKSNSAYYGGKVPFYKPIDLDAGRFVDSSAEYLSEAGKAISRVVPIGSTAVCCIGSIGKAGYLIKEGTTNQQINCVIPSEAVDSVFLYYLCTSPLFYQELITLSSAVTISIINKSKMENIIVPLPPIEEQKRIVSKIEDLFGFIKTIEESL
ncbi:restriction endonuclease subunit S [Prevotella melaninogenica]|uniref:Restriction endonuclease subunit S n=2 Tax=Prevotella melaninogenica TaxID=28132 RepID=A0A7D4KEQ1_9BACT|nr:restriction endonuclease subunit S [Prevotella melaninogenica]